LTITQVVSVGSTNTDLLDDLRCEEGDWLSAACQTGGRGRNGRKWASIPGNLHASTLVRFTDRDPAPGSLALLAGVALHEALAIVAPGVTLRIKWPNDVLAAGAKLAGILLERRETRVVVGFGVNIVGAPALDDRATTSLAALGFAASTDGVLAVLVDRFAFWLERWHDGDIAGVRTAWLAAAHPKGTPLSVQSGLDPRIDGLFDGLDESGALRLRLADGTTRVIHAGDVFLL